MDNLLIKFNKQQSPELRPLPFEQRHAILAVRVQRRLAFLVEEQISGAQTIQFEQEKL